jgi:prepilin-type N-terminal cleavage/methylation domain-containing protein
MARSVSRGFTLIEALLVVAVVGILAVLTVPDLGRGTALLRAQLAAQEVARALHGARMIAVRQGKRVAVRFNTDDPKHVTYTVFQDGNGNGVRNRDIGRGVDPPLGPAQQLQRLGKTVRFGFPPGIRPRQIGHPHRYLDRLDDPIRFNRSDLASFDPLGTSTPGTVYLTAGNATLVAVRVFNRTGKIVVMTYDPDSGLWRR